MICVRGLVRNRGLHLRCALVALETHRRNERVGEGHPVAVGVRHRVRVQIACSCHRFVLCRSGCLFVCPRVQPFIRSWCLCSCRAAASSVLVERPRWRESACRVIEEAVIEEAGGGGHQTRVRSSRRNQAGDTARCVNFGV